MQYQKSLRFEEPKPVQQEPEIVAENTCLPPPPLVRPDRQIVYESSNPHHWPDSEALCDHNTITVDRVQPGMDGAAHRFLIKRDDTVEAWFGKDNFKAGVVVGISHARKQVRVRFTLGTEGQWFSVGAIYPAPEPEGMPVDRRVSLASVVAQVNAKHAPESGFSDVDRVPQPISDKQMLAHLAATPGREFAASELRTRFGHTDFDPDRPQENAVHAALATLRDRGVIHVTEPQYGEPRISVLRIPETARELTRCDCPSTLAGIEVRKLLRDHGWTINSFAGRWGFTRKHVREVLDRGLSDQNAVYDWIEAALTTPEVATQRPEPSSYTFDEFKRLIKDLGRHESFEQYHTDFKRLLQSREAVISELLSRYKAPQLKNVAGNLGEWNARQNNKQQNAESIYRKMLGYYLLDGSVTVGMGESYLDAVKAKVLAVTEAQWISHYAGAEAKRAEQLQALHDPQDLRDFRVFIEARGEEALSDEQMARWDKLHADLARERRVKAGPASTVARFQSDEVHGVEFTIKEGYHEKRDCRLWIVQLGDRVEKETYRELLGKAKQLGGWYSSYKKSDAGFQFSSEEAATRFTSLLAGDADRTDLLAERKERKEQTTAERLHELANEMMERAEQTIQRSGESLQNTARRADIQAGVRGRAYADAALARTLHSVANALSTGEVNYLDGVRHRTHVEELDRVLVLARWARIRAIRKASDESEYGFGLRIDEEEAKPLSEDDMRFVNYPYPHIYVRHLRELTAATAHHKGLKQLTAKLSKRIPKASAENDFITFRSEHEVSLLADYLLRTRAAGIDCQRASDELIHYQRLHRAKLGDIHELRAALREYLPHKASVRGDDPVLVAERELIGKDLPGFFPTPQPVIQQMLDLAQIEDGHTVLEPSCGKGDIVTAIQRGHPHALVTAIEMNRTLAEVLAAKGIDLEFGDFLKHQGTYARIVMNPPFERGQDMDHVRHAYECLAAGGRLVSVMSEGSFFRSDSRASEFRTWFDKLAGVSILLPENAFSGAEAFRQTGVRTRLVVIDNRQRSF
ncbi:methyltransferase [Aeoliella sp.]|uniref:methyltransferase n=1 Tax=Aeoliella sp. TaxID=2795800 RepID=UPI003CCBFF08